MRASLAVVSAVSLLPLVALAGSAAAQSGPPGQCGDCAAPPALWVAPGGAPGVAPPEPWEAHRFALGLHLGAVSIDDSFAPDGQQQFSTGGLVARYRASRRLELELAIDHGNQQIDEMKTDYQLTAATASLLVHMRPQARWDWYLLAGVGANERRFKDAADETADARAHLAFGAGLEYRFDHLVLGLEVRGLAIGARERDDVRIAAVNEDDEGTGGAQASLGASWYF
jgi:opacity protein-like surface antigen